MVTILSPGKSIRSSFYYNENKVSEGVAKLIHAENYPREAADLNENMRLNMLLKLAEQNTRAQVNSLHISINFDPSEQLSEAKLTEITRQYMDKIGFGNQPYLIYQHFDAGHPHVHVVTTNIEADGNLISLHHLGIRLSEPARKVLEIQHNLVKAEDQNQSAYELKPAYTGKVTYGRSDSRRAIAGVLNELLNKYQYTSLPELNALLSQYNVMADRGTEQSRVFKNQGLNYRILDDQGKPIGVPIKASAFYNKPTLKFLQNRFLECSKTKSKYKINVRNAVDTVLRDTRIQSLSTFRRALKTVGVNAVIRQNKDGIVYGITFVDHKTKTVFNGRDLGKEYGAKAILERFAPAMQVTDPNKQAVSGKYLHPAFPYPTTPSGDPFFNENNPSDATKILQDLMENEGSREVMPYELTGRKKKKNKRKSI